MNRNPNWYELFTYHQRGLPCPYRLQWVWCTDHPYAQAQLLCLSVIALAMLRAFLLILFSFQHHPDYLCNCRHICCQISVGFGYINNSFHSKPCFSNSARVVSSIMKNFLKLTKHLKISVINTVFPKLRLRLHGYCVILQKYSPLRVQQTSPVWPIASRQAKLNSPVRNGTKSTVQQVTNFRNW